MSTNRRPRGLTRVELIVLIVIVVVLVGLIIPAVDSAREAGRRASCMNKTRQIGLAFQNYASTFNNSFPPSASLTKAPDGTGTVGGWSFLVRLLPFMEYDALYKTLPTRWRSGGHLEPSDHYGDEHPAQRIRLPKQSAGVHAAAISGHHQLQGHGSHDPRQPCDGREPAGNAAVWHHVADPWHTAASSRWCDISRHRQLPACRHPRRPFAYDLHDRNDRRGCQPLDGWQRGHAGRYAAEQFAHGHDTASHRITTSPRPVLTTLRAQTPPSRKPVCEHSSRMISALQVPMLASTKIPGFGQTPPAYGPSSMHPGVVICGMGDGSVQPISKQIDAANLFFLITKNNNDPFWALAP